MYIENGTNSTPLGRTLQGSTYLHFEFGVWVLTFLLFPTLITHPLEALSAEDTRTCLHMEGAVSFFYTYIYLYDKESLPQISCQQFFFLSMLTTVASKRILLVSATFFF
jgi:hypothetical protein